MWKKLKDIYGGDDNVRRAKAKSLRSQFDKMKMREDENITKYVERIKSSVSAIKESRGDIKDGTFVRYLELFFLSMQLECLLFNK